MRIGTSRIVAILLLGAGAPIAHAQMIGGGGGGSPLSSIGGKSQAPAPPKALPPPALPGAAQNAGRVTPSYRPPMDLEPTEALFDAINRGDIASARDAISRGAELNGRNILGMTPMELSVDLGRNDISFLLLSMRGADGGHGRGGQPASTRVTATKAAPTGPAARSRTMPAKAPTQPTQAQQTARLFSGDGGAPIPDAGFLGFDTGRR